MAQVEKLYAGLKELANERRAKLDDALKLFMLNREVDDLEQWIAEREVVAGSHELGQDYDHVTLLWERFREFAKDTQMIGDERVNGVNDIADSLISSGHTGKVERSCQSLSKLVETCLNSLKLVKTR